MTLLRTGLRLTRFCLLANSVTSTTRTKQKLATEQRRGLHFRISIHTQVQLVLRESQDLREQLAQLVLRVLHHQLVRQVRQVQQVQVQLVQLEPRVQQEQLALRVLLVALQTQEPQVQQVRLALRVLREQRVPQEPQDLREQLVKQVRRLRSRDLLAQQGRLVVLVLQEQQVPLRVLQVLQVPREVRALRALLVQQERLVHQALLQVRQVLKE